MDNQRSLMVTLVLLTTMTAVVSSLGAPLVPEIARVHDVRLTTAQWILTATLLSAAVATPILGRLASGRLRRPAILVGLAVVTAGCLLAVLPLGFPALVVGRTMQGIGMALVPLAIAVARDVLPAERVTRAVAVLSVSTVAGAGLGYPVTATVAQLGGLVAAYVLGTVLSALTLLMAWRFLPQGAGERPARVDWTGAALLSVGMVALLLAVSEGETWGWASPRTLGLGAVGVVLLAAWVRWTLRSRTPLVDLRLAGRPGIAGPNLVAVCAGVGMYALLTMTVVVVQSDQPGFGVGAPVWATGLVLVPYALLSVSGNQAARWTHRRFGPAPLLPLGCASFLTATVLLALVHDHLWQALAWMALGGLGSGFTFSSLAMLMVPHVPQAETGSAMAFNQVLRYLGMTCGSALSVALMAVLGGGDAGYRGSLLLVSSIWPVAVVGLFLLSRRDARLAACSSTSSSMPHPTASSSAPVS